MGKNLLTEEDCKTILRNCYGDPSINFVSFEIGPLSDNVEGFLGEHYKLKISYEKNGEQKVGSFFIKTKPTGTQMQEMLVEQMNCYEKEIHFYGLLQEYKRRGFEIGYAPKCYLTKNKKTLVLHDMNDQGYAIGKRGTVFNLSQCECMLKSLAEFHAAGYVFQEEKTKELGRPYCLDEDNPSLYETKAFLRDGNEFFASMMQFTKNMAITVVGMLKESPEFKEEFIRELNGIDVFEQFHREMKCKKTIAHGDLWSNNLLFLKEKEISIKCCLVDYQTFAYYHPGYDVLLGILGNTDINFRKQYFNYLIDYYYGCLSDELKNHGYAIDEIVPFEDFKEALDQVECCARYQAMGVHSLTFTPPSVVDEWMAKGDEGFKDLRGWKRIDMFKESFANYETLRNMITQDVYDLYNCLQRMKRKRQKLA